MPFKLVEEFNRQILEIPELEGIQNMTAEEVRFLYTALQEEFEEWLDAVGEQDLVGQVDALLDLIYFAMGGLTRLGLNHEQSLKCFKAVHEANMSKTKGNKGRNTDVDAVKATNWQGPENKIKLIIGACES